MSLLEEAKKLLALIDQLTPLEGDQQDRVFAAYEFDGLRAAVAAEASPWRPIDTAPKDGTMFLCWAPSKHDLPPMYSLCASHEDAGFCIDELREPSIWMPLPPVGTPASPWVSKWSELKSDSRYLICPINKSTSGNYYLGPGTTNMGWQAKSYKEGCYLAMELPDAKDAITALLAAEKK